MHKDIWFQSFTGALIMTSSGCLDQ